MTTQTTNELLSNKNDLKSTTNQNTGRTTNTFSICLENCLLNENNGHFCGTVGTGAPNQNDNPNWLKLQALKQRKLELEKLLSEKTILIEELQRQEEEVQNGTLLPGNSATGILKRKIGTNNEPPKNQLNSIRNLNSSIEIPNFLPNIEKLLHEKKHLQEICNTLFKLTNDLNTSTLVQKTHQSEFDVAQQKLIQINDQLNLLKKLELNQEQGIQNSQQLLVKSNSLRGAHNSLTWTSLSTNLVSSTLNSKLNKSPKQQNYNKQKSPIPRKCNSNNSINLMQHQNVQNSTATQQLEKSVCRKKFCNDNELNSLQQHTCPQRTNHHQYHHHKHITLGEQSLENSNELHSSKNLLKNDYLLNESLTIKRYQKMCEGIQQFNQEYNLKLQQQAQLPLFSPMECETNNSHATQSQQKNFRMNTQKLSPPQYQQQKPISQTRIPPIPVSPVYHKYENNCDQNIESPTLLLSDKYYFSPTQQKYSNGSFIKSSQNVRPQDSKQKTLVKPKSNQIDDISLSLHITDGNKERLGRNGLSEYWQISPNNDRVWVSDKTSDSNLNSYDQRNSKNKLHQENIDNSQEKSSSLHNFDLLLIKHSDQLSITSIGTTNSNLNQLPEKDKLWVETALDGPLLNKSKQSHKNTRNCDSNFETISQAQQLLPATLFATQNTQIDSSSTFNPTLRNQQSNQDPDFDAANSTDNLKSRNSMNYTQSRTKVAAQPTLDQPAMPIQEFDSKFKVKKQGRQTNFSHSTPYLNGVIKFDQSNPKNANFEQLHLDNTISKLGVHTDLNVENEFSNNSTVKLKEQQLNAQNDEQSSEISDQKFHMAYTRSGTPKNLSVGHPAIFMPYKEYSKPFEMSDFYKYSTKFRQQQQQFSFRRKTNDWDPNDIKKTAN